MMKLWCILLLITIYMAAHGVQSEVQLQKSMNGDKPQEVSLTDKERNNKYVHNGSFQAQRRSLTEGEDDDESTSWWSRACDNFLSIFDCFSRDDETDPEIDPTPSPTTPEPTSPAPTTPDSTRAPTPGPTPAPTNFPTATPDPLTSKYMGCWGDNDLRAMEYSAEGTYGTDTCLHHCRDLGYMYAGLEFGNQCFCGNKYNRYEQLDDSKCRHICSVGGGMCGGPWTLSVYGVGRTRWTSFNVDLDLIGVKNVEVFKDAVAKWTKVITGDTKEVTVSLPGESACGAWPSFVDDLYICGKAQDIGDGPGGIVGYAGTRHYHIGGTPVTGEIVFDSVDMDQSWFNQIGVILREMGHVLGVGSMWEANDLVPQMTVPCPYALDSAATREYQRLSGCTDAIPVEMSYDLDSGSNCGHWQESCFGSEMMTHIGASDELPVSSITIAGLEDLGYEVNYDEADASDMNPSCICNNDGGLRRKLVDGMSFSTSQKEDDASSRRLQLSSDGKSAAMKYGKELLANRRDLAEPLPEGIADLGEDVVFVLYLEDETVHSVLVSHL